MRRGLVRTACFGVVAVWLMCTPGAFAQFQPHDVNWQGLSADLGIFRPFNSRVLIIDDHKVDLGNFNLTGIHAAAATAYLFQQGWLVIGPRAKLSGGLVETMPLDFTVRTNLILTFGGEAGVAMERWYFYGFGGGGAAWLSAERVRFGRADNFVPAYEVGAGFRYKITRDWYVKSEVSYVTLGDQRLGAEYFDPKPFIAATAGFGIQFNSGN